MLIRDKYLAIDRVFQHCLYTSDLYTVRKEFSDLDDASQKAVLNQCGRMLKQNHLASAKNGAARIGTVKLIIAAFPASSDLIDSLLRRRYAGRQREILFTLFCFADRLLSFKHSQSICGRVLSFAKGFLLNVNRNTCHAAWMAGDLLGAHWRLGSALPVLLEAATRARYAAGREAAIDGLAKAFERTRNADRRKQIVKLVQDIHTTDRSHAVRLSARLFLDHSARPEPVEGASGASNNLT